MHTIVLELSYNNIIKTTNVYMFWVLLTHYQRVQ